MNVSPRLPSSFLHMGNGLLLALTLLELNIDSVFLFFFLIEIQQSLDVDRDESPPNCIPVLKQPKDLGL